MFKFSLFPGEGYSFDKQLEICGELGFGNLEISGDMGGKSFLDLDSDSMIKKVIVNKIHIPMLNISKPIETYAASDVRDIVHKCGLIGIEYLNIGDLKHCENNKLPDDLLKYCELHNVRLCVENRNGCSLNENPDAFFKDTVHADISMVYNPLEVVRSGYHPFLNVFYGGRFKNRVLFLRICDGIYADGVPKLPGDGGAEIKELVSALQTRRFTGYLSLCPYFENQTIHDYRIIFRRLCLLLSDM